MHNLFIYKISNFIKIYIVITFGQNGTA